jgi:hypothetical protein
MIQMEVKCGEVTQLPQYCECRDVREARIVFTMN